MEKKVVVTGAGGFLGSHICCYLQQQGYQVVGVGRFSIPVSKYSIYSNMQKIVGMTLPDQSFTRIIEDFQPTLLIHCAGTASVPSSVKEPFEDFRRSVDICAYALENLRRYDADCHFVFLSSAAVYGNPISLPITEDTLCKPISPYGFHKRLCELLVKEYQALHGISTSIIRIFSAYGERLRKQVIFDLCDKFSKQENNPIEVYGTGQETRDFIHALDVAQAIECLYKNHATGIFNVASGEQVKICDLVETIQSFFGGNHIINYSNQVREGDPICWKADISKLISLGFKQKISFDQGIRGYCEWYLGNRDHDD